MEKNEKSASFREVDLLRLAGAVWHRAWIVLIVAVLAAAIGFCYATYELTPTYSSSIMLYINNSSIDLSDLGTSISLGELSTAQRLIATYTVLLKNRTTLQKVAKETGLPYDWGTLQGMITADSVNETEIMRITVTCGNPDEAATIANAIAKVLPLRVAEIVGRSSVEVVDSAIPNYTKVGPNITRYTTLGLALGILVSVGLLVIFALMDNTIHDEDYIIHTYDLPILAKIPNLLDNGKKRYGYYYRYQYKSRK